MLIGNYKVAIVTMVQGANITKKYAFALYDKNIKIDDLVLCDTQYGYSVAQVVNVIDQSEYEGVNITKEIICKVDFDDFEKRAEMKTKMKKLKSTMDKKVKEVQGLALIELLSEKSPELKTILEEYKGLMKECEGCL